MGQLSNVQAQLTLAQGLDMGHMKQAEADPKVDATSLLPNFFN
jgi:hypothetical protein